MSLSGAQWALRQVLAEVFLIMPWVCGFVLMNTEETKLVEGGGVEYVGLPENKAYEIAFLPQKSLVVASPPPANGLGING